MTRLQGKICIQFEVPICQIRASSLSWLVLLCYVKILLKVMGGGGYSAVGQTSHSHGALSLALETGYIDQIKTLHPYRAVH